VLGRIVQNMVDETKFECKFCSEEFQYKSFGIHKRECVGRPMHFECPSGCDDQTMDTQEKVKVHLENECKKFRVKCNQCNDRFDRKTYLKHTLKEVS
jgi:hypothetical protein